MIIVYVDKPFIGKQLANILEVNFPNNKIVFIHSFYFKNIGYQYPNFKKWEEYPYIGMPSYKVEPLSRYNPCTYSYKNGMLEQQDVVLSEDDILNARIIYAADPGSYETYNFTIFYRHFFNKVIDMVYIDSLALYSLDEESLKKALFNMSNFSKTFKKTIEVGKIKRYFDYVYNTNSLAIFGKTLKNMSANEIYMSKYTLILLYYLNNSHPMTESQIISAMSKWCGSGKYKDKVVKLGSCTSMASILENLENLKFIDKVSSKITISQKGKEFLFYLNKKCYDPDLPFKLSLWEQMDFKQAKDKIDHYILQFFMRQKTFIDNGYLTK